MINDSDIYNKLLREREINPTSIRILVLKVLYHAERSLSLSDIENILETVDKSTIFRTVTLFLSQRLIHSIDDGTGSIKYAFCSSDCKCSVEQLHTHFHCEKCNATFCFKNIPSPIVPIPNGFSINSINYVLKGICPECNKKEKVVNP